MSFDSAKASYVPFARRCSRSKMQVRRQVSGDLHTKMKREWTCRKKDDLHKIFDAETRTVFYNSVNHAFMLQDKGTCTNNKKGRRRFDDDELLILAQDMPLSASLGEAGDNVGAMHAMREAIAILPATLANILKDSIGLERANLRTEFQRVLGLHET